MRALQCLEVALIQPCHELGVRSGRSFYYQPDRPQELSNEYELWYGLFQSVVLGERPLFNIDVSHKAFLKPINVIDFLENSGRRRGNDYNSLLDVLKNKNLIYTPPKEFNASSKSFRLFDLGNSADTEFFENNEKKVVSIQEYYRSKGYEIKNPSYKVLKTESGCCFPMELCVIAPGQSVENSATSVVAQIVKYAASNTQQRKAKIMELFQHFHGIRSPIIERFGISLGDKFIQLEARRLFAPNLSYHGDSKVRPNNGKWFIPNGLTFLEPAKSQSSLIKWAVVNLDQNIQWLTVSNCNERLVSLASDMGIPLDPKVVYHELGRKRVEQIFDDIKSEGCKFALIILSDRGNCSYAKVKKTAELQYGIITQCIKSFTIRNRWDNATVNNVLLKLNSKLNGVNHKVKSESNPPVVSSNYVMFVGADVTHPPPLKQSVPSVVGVVSSSDNSGSKYNMQHFYQEPKKEIIVSMKDIMIEHIGLYAKSNNGSLPTHIIYYRDGVADGQFELVKEQELRNGMELAFKEVSCNFSFLNT